jgi:hypothetical protein
LSIPDTVNRDLKAEEGLDEPRPTRDVRAVVQTYGSFGQRSDGIPLKKVVEYSVGIIQDIGRLKDMMALTKNVIDPWF